MTTATQQRIALTLLVTGSAGLLAGARLPEEVQRQSSRLIAAAREGNLAQMKQLLGRGADPNAKDDEGTPVLMLAAMYASGPAVKMLLDAGADPRATNKAGATALIWAAGDPVKARMLIAKGADVNARSGAGRTPLLVAAAHDGSFETVKALLDKGAAVNAHDELAGPVFTGGGGDTPLIEAAKTSDLHTVRLLIERGATVNGTGRSGNTALHEAALRGSVEIVRELLRNGASPSGSIERFEVTPLILAAMRASTETIDALIGAGARLDAKDAGGSTALMWAAYSDRADPKPVEALLAAGADWRVKNKMGETAMTWAARRGATPVVALLEKASGETAPKLQSEIAQPGAAAIDPREAVLRAMKALDKSGPVFFKNSGCISCHNQSLPLEVSGMSKANGIPVDEQAEKKQLLAVLSILKPAREILAEGTDVVPDLPVTGGYLLAALAAQKYAPDAMTAAVVHAIAGRQRQDGSWIGWSPRPPLENGDIQATALAIRAIELYGVPGRKAEFSARVARARGWLRGARAITTEEKSMRLAGLVWAHAGASDIEAAGAVLLAEQRPDGGWSQLTTLESDAYATGKALVVLHDAGRLSGESEPYRRGVAFLLGSQSEDGTWRVRTRAFPFQPLKDSGFPHGRDQWISATGTSWAAMSLQYAR